MKSTETETETLPRRKGVYIALAIIVAWLGFLAYAIPRIAVDGTSIDPPRHNPEVDFDWALNDLDGKPVSFGDYKGKALFVNCWATWCGPCKLEMPSIARLSALENVKDVTFLLISTEENPEAVRRYLAANPELKDSRLKFLMARDMNRAFLSEAIPATFLVSTQGKVVGEHIGSTEWDRPEVAKVVADLAVAK